MAGLTPMQIESGLEQFTGTENRYAHPLFKSFTYTDGVRYMAQECNAYWLIDAILSHQGNVRLGRGGFQVWILTKDGTHWILYCEDGDNNRIIQQRIEFSDFPLQKMTIWLTDNVLLLPSEY